MRGTLTPYQPRNGGETTLQSPSSSHNPPSHSGAFYSLYTTSKKLLETKLARRDVRTTTSARIRRVKKNHCQRIVSLYCECGVATALHHIRVHFTHSILLLCQFQPYPNSVGSDENTQPPDHGNTNGGSETL